MAVGTKDYKTRLNAGKRWILGSGAIAFVGIGIFLAYTRFGNSTTQEINASLIPVERGRVAEILSVSGVVQLGNQQTLKSPLELGVVEQVGVRVSDPVTVGQTLMTLRNSSRQTAVIKQQLEIQKQELNLLQQQEAVRAAQAKFNAARDSEDTEIASSEIELEKAKLQLQRDREKVTEAQNELVQLQQELNELNTLLDRGFISANEVREQEKKLEQGRANRRDNQLKVEQQSLEITRLEEKIAIARNQPKSELIDTENQLNTAKISVRNAERDLSIARLVLKEAQAQQAESAIAATINGSVLDLAVKSGDVVKTDDILLTLGNRDREQVIVQLSPLDAAKVKVGQSAIVSIIGPNAEEYAAKVENIAQIAKNSSDDSSRNSQTTVTAILSLNTPSRQLIPDSSVSAEIILAEQTNVVFVNTELIQREGQETWVWVRNTAGVAEKRPVTLGLEGLTTVEIKMGLIEGETVIQPTPDLDLKPGLPISQNS
ncbi:MAG: HlyD family efflux transporter periplasmic adaptor subunit [Jaaginema sp. PMC 1079.18]|nr:HlyD family efflux transporter periplasmic adaptor subunit [Jaaginema sp. PMC 1080.18]MEC4852844.1 HlyD family efflux transporter periplasmic adaptor subunit [Jaaginema sp. PMC 1079.18]MEC4868508.1 HlyD family efflux transporter periplasmic adaptor subunit [Jaaginema sp. PMC 1078.18]